MCVISNLNQTSKFGHPIPHQFSASPLLSTLPSKIEKRGECTLNWGKRIVAQLDHFDTELDKKIPNLWMQRQIDEISSWIQLQFAPLTELNAWLDSQCEGSWANQLATSLVKLPISSVRAIVNVLYRAISAILYTAVHPLKGLNHIAKLIVKLIYELTQPESWSKIGAGMIGFRAGSPLCLIAVGIGSAMILGGLSVQALKAALEGEENAVQNGFVSTLKQLPESALTGALLGGIQRFLSPSAVAQTREISDLSPWVDSTTSRPPSELDWGLVDPYYGGE